MYMKGISAMAKSLDRSVLSEKLALSNAIDSALFDKFDVKRGLRNRDGSGVLAGLSRVSSVIGFHKVENELKPVEGALKYRGISIQDIVAKFPVGSRFCFEQVTYFLLVGDFPTKEELATTLDFMATNRVLPDAIVSSVLNLPSMHVMNKLQTAISALYAYDETPDSIDAYENFIKSLALISRLPLIVAYGYLKAYKPQAKLVLPPAEMSVAESFLYVLHEGAIPDPFDVYVLDLCLVLHAEHGGGNNSTFATRVVTSSESDLYSAMAAAVGSLKGPLHGSANKKVMEMMADIMANVPRYEDMDALRAYLLKILGKETFDKSGKLYGLGHAVYTKSDPRSLILTAYARRLAGEKGRQRELDLYFAIAEMAPVLFQEVKGKDKIIAPNVDFFSGFVYDCLGIPEPLYTPIFGLARAAGWCAHRIEELVSAKRIIRPAYKYVESSLGV
jgi:citrate synthase